MNIKLGFVSGSLSGGFATEAEKDAAGIVHDGLHHAFRTDIRNYLFSGFTAQTEKASKDADKVVDEYVAHLLTQPTRDQLIVPAWIAVDTLEKIKYRKGIVVE